MWTRAELKSTAKYVLNATYWKSFLAVLACLGLGTAASLVGNIIPGLGAIAAAIFLTLPLQVGLYGFFLSSRLRPTEVGKIFSVFERGYIETVGAMAWMALFLFLWALIPVAGIVLVIIKGIAYSMTPFILADNPQIGYGRTLKLSIAMTNGHKGAIFVLYLSFLGWYILGMLCFGIGLLFLMRISTRRLRNFMLGSAGTPLKTACAPGRNCTSTHSRRKKKTEAGILPDVRFPVVYM